MNARRRVKKVAKKLATKNRATKKKATKKKATKNRATKKKATKKKVQPGGAPSPIPPPPPPTPPPAPSANGFERYRKCECLRRTSGKKRPLYDYQRCGECERRYETGRTEGERHFRAVVSKHPDRFALGTLDDGTSGVRQHLLRRQFLRPQGGAALWFIPGDDPAAAWELLDIHFDGIRPSGELVLNYNLHAASGSFTWRNGSLRDHLRPLRGIFPVGSDLHEDLGDDDPDWRYHPLTRNVSFDESTRKQLSLDEFVRIVVSAMLNPAEWGSASQRHGNWTSRASGSEP